MQALTRSRLSVRVHEIPFLFLSTSMIPWLRSRVRTSFCIIIAVSLLSFGTAIDWGLPRAVSPETVGPWELDSVAPILPLNEAYHGFTRKGNDWVTYPILHLILLDIAYAPYLAVQYFQGDLKGPSTTFPYGLKDPIRICKDLTLIARLVSLAMGIGIVLMVYRITAELFSPQAAFWASLLSATLPPLSYYAKVSNLDVPYVFWLCLACWEHIRILKTQRLTHYVRFGIFTAFAIATKDQAYGFFVLAPIIIIYALARRRTSETLHLKDLASAAFAKPLLLSMVVAITAFALANNLFFGGWSGFIRHLYTILGPGSQPWRQFPNTLAGQAALLLETKHLLVHMFGYGSLILCLAGVFYAVVMRQWLSLSLLLFPLSYYIFFIAVVGYTYTRFLLGPSVLLTPFAGALIARLLKTKASVRLPAVIAVACSLAWQGAITVNLALTLLNDSRHQAETWMRNHIASGATIEALISHERLLPHISKDWMVSLCGQDEAGRPIPADLSAAGLNSRNPQYIVLLSLGFSGDIENWQFPDLIKYRTALLEGKLGYRVLAQFQTPYFIPFRLITGTRPRVTVLSRL
jgi:Dolichyl-phosphate-mannose-protein mannosyltransferase